MRIDNKYICEVCDTEYTTEESAALCESKHLRDLEVAHMKYEPLKPWPSKVVLTDPIKGTKQVYVKA